MACPIFDATGSKLFPGWWNTANTPMIYASRHYSTAMLEKPVHGSDRLPNKWLFIEITIPNGVSYDVVSKDHLPGWAPDCAVTRAHGAMWQRERQSVLLIVPSVVARMERIC